MKLHVLSVVNYQNSTLGSKDTLSLRHESKKKDFPGGKAIDRVLSRNITHLTTEAIEVGFLNHKAIVSKFNLSR